jgi:hypothetical protein
VKCEILWSKINDRKYLEDKFCVLLDVKTKNNSSDLYQRRLDKSQIKEAKVGKTRKIKKTKSCLFARQAFSIKV